MKVPAFHGEVGFNAQHSPMGAYFSFTCGHFGTRGGMGVQMGKPAGQDVFVGVKEGGRYEKVPLKVLPFFEGAEKLDPRAAFLAEKDEAGDVQRFAPWGKNQIVRRFGWGTDRWEMEGGGVEFSIYSPFGEIPEPKGIGGVGEEEALKEALWPGVVAELIVDNRKGEGVKTAFFAINFLEGGVRVLEGLGEGRAGIAWRAEMGFAAEVVDMTEKGGGGEEVVPFVFVKWWPHEGLEDRSNPVHLLGTCGGVGVEVPAGKCYALRMSLGCYVGGVVTTRLEGRYFYSRFYSGVEEVLRAGLERFCDLKKRAKGLDEELVGSGLSADQQFLIAQATRSYYGNTELLEAERAPYWIVNEGEYCMMNTLDLAVDQVFWELERNPWVVRNVLEGFLKRYSYVDRVKIGTTENTEGTETKEGGISFCHDQGTHNQFSPFGTSAYECRDLTGCFSFMTQEELCNWVLMATSYVAKTGDKAWLVKHENVLTECLTSMTVRTTRIKGTWADNPKEVPNGIMRFDSALCGAGSEITTYDSLDSSLGQARNNFYLAMKCWSTYIGLGIVFADLSRFDGHWQIAGMHMPRIIADALSKNSLADGTLPPNLAADVAGSSRILPVIEAIAYRSYWESHWKRSAAVPGYLRDEFQIDTLFPILQSHAISILTDPDQRNKFADGGIRLSSSSDNSWLSKIAIVQHVARVVFNLDEDGKERAPNAGASGWERADAAHVKWLTTGAGAYWCACDQIVNGVAKGSKYYPRLITAALWLGETSERRGD